MRPFSLSWKFLPLFAVAALLGGCLGDGDSTPTAAPTTLGGTAATGAPIVGGTVTVKCAAGPTLTDITDSSGVWEVTVSGQTLPCAIEVSGGNLAAGQAYHSIALQLGTVNITPLTDLIVANMAGQAPGIWFSGLNANAYQQLTASAMNAALSNLRTAFDLTALNGIDPVTASFTATSGNTLDDILEALRTAYADYAALLNSATGSGFFSYAAQYRTALNNAYALLLSPGTGTGGVLVCNQSLFSPNAVHAASATELAAYQGSYTGEVYSFNATSGQSTGPTAGNVVFNANGSLTLNGQAKAPTSICVDNVSGGSGITLYVHFADGHVDLWPNKTFSASLETTSGGGTSGNATLTVSVSAAGVLTPNIVIGNVPRPSSQQDFCAAVQNDTTFTGIGTAAGGTLTIDACSYSNNTGSISATLRLTAPIAMTLPYTVTYTYN